MKILAIETSCDETGIALVEGEKTESGSSFKVLQAALLSQASLHSPYGGVYPNLAKREHEKNLPALFQDFKNETFDAVAVTQGPGLEPALWTGIEFAKQLAKERGVPLLATNHMEGHIISSLVQGGELTNLQFPLLALLISGGHTELVLSKEMLSYTLVGQTLDDAVGEAFDKVARMLGLPYPGGPEISRLAAQSRVKSHKSSITLPRPMLQSNTCDFSFSGLKTAALYALRDKGGVQNMSADEVAAFSAELEDAISDVLVSKTRTALEQTQAKMFVIGGGVAANIHLREKLQTLIASEFSDVEFRLPELSITGDNAIMIAQAALVRALSGKNDQTDDTLRAVGNLSLIR